MIIENIKENIIIDKKVYILYLYTIKKKIFMYLFKILQK
jgi:hypothetical protein